MGLVYLSVDGDDIGNSVARARMTDDIGEVRRLDQAIKAGNKLWSDWAISCGSVPLEEGGDEVLLEVGAQHLIDVQDLMRQYKELVGATCSVGVGEQISTSSKALLVAKARGKARALVWFPDMQGELDAILSAPKTEIEKIQEAHLQKDEGAPPPAPKQKPPTLQVHEQEEQKQESPLLSDQFHALAMAQGKRDQEDSKVHESHLDEVRAAVVQTLEGVRQRLPVIQQFKETAPEVYRSFLELVQGLIGLAQEAFGSTVGPETEAAPEASTESPEGLQKDALDAAPTPESTPQSSGENLGLNRTGSNAHRGGGTQEGRSHIKLPVGTTMGNKLKIRHRDGRAGWKNLSAGMVQGPEPGAPLFAANSFPVSSRQPGKA